MPLDPTEKLLKSYELAQRQYETDISVFSTRMSLFLVADSGPLYIADGHHRYETAVAYAQEVPGARR